MVVWQGPKYASANIFDFQNIFVWYLDLATVNVLLMP